MVPVLEKLPSVSGKAGFPPWMFLNSPRKMLGMQSKSEMSKQKQWISCKTHCLLPLIGLSLFSQVLEKKHPSGTSLDLPGTSGQRRSCLISCRFCEWNSPLRLALNQRRPRFWVQARIHHQLATLVDKLFESKKNNLPHIRSKVLANYSECPWFVFMSH